MKPSSKGMNDTPRSDDWGAFGAFLIATAIFGVVTASPSFADYASRPVTGAAVVTNGKFTNIYLYPDPDKETWDQHLVSLTNSGIIVNKDGMNVDPADTSESIDAFTLELTRSHYFDALAQYHAGLFGWGDSIHPPIFLGTETTIKKCVDAALKDLGPDMTLGYGTLRSFANCEQSTGGNPSQQVNLILSPEFNIAEFDLLGNATGDCKSGPHVTGFHGFGLYVPNFTVNPTRPICNQFFSDLTQNLSHEMVETLSDPAGWGYIHESGTVARWAGDEAAQFNQGELGDICEEGGPQNPNSIPGVAFVQMLGTSVSKYWSNNDGCVPLFGTVDTSKYYKIIARHSGKVLDVRGALLNDSVPIQQWDDTGGDNQQWQFADQGDGSYSIMARNSGKVIDIPGGNDTNGTLLAQFTPTGNWNQKWTITSAGGLFVEIHTVRFSNWLAFTRVLDIQGGPTARGNGVPVQLWDDLGGANQQWSLVPVDPVPGSGGGPTGGPSNGQCANGELYSAACKMCLPRGQVCTACPVGLIYKCGTCMKAADSCR